MVQMYKNNQKKKNRSEHWIHLVEGEYGRNDSKFKIQINWQEISELNECGRQIGSIVHFPISFHPGMTVCILLGSLNKVFVHSLCHFNRNVSCSTMFFFFEWTWTVNERWLRWKSAPPLTWNVIQFLFRVFNIFLLFFCVVPCWIFAIFFFFWILLGWQCPPIHKFRSNISEKRDLSLSTAESCWTLNVVLVSLFMRTYGFDGMLKFVTFSQASAKLRRK